AYQRWPNPANSCSPSDRRQDLGAVVGDRDRVLEMGRQRAVTGHNGPAIGLDRDVAAAEGQHRLDREADAGRELHALDAGPVVRDLRLLVHLRPDPVADELPDDPVPVWRGDVLDGAGDVAEIGVRYCG